MDVEVYLVLIIFLLVLILIVLLSFISKIARHNKELEHAIYRLIEIVKSKNGL